MKLMIASPSISNRYCGEYVQGIIALQAVAAKSSTIETIEYTFHAGGSHISGARNKIADLFLKSNCDSLLSIDDDVGFNGKDVVDMVELDLDLVGGTYPRKALDYESAFNAAKSGADLAGFKRALMTYSFASESNVVYNPTKRIIRTDSVPTGLLLASRRTFDEIRKRCPENEMIGKFNFFGYGPVDGDRKEWGEDYYFSKLAMKSGIQPHIYLGAKVDHYGLFRYEGFRQ